MKKNLLNEKNKVEFVKAGEMFEGEIATKNVYNAVIAVGEELIEVPYKDIKTIIE